MPKVKKKSVAQKAREARQRQRLARQNAEYAEREKVQNAAAMRVTREDNEYSTRERTRNAAAMRVAREDTEYSTRERERNAAAMRVTREDTEYSTCERARNTGTMRVTRANVEYSTRERARNAAAMRDAREDPSNSSRERANHAAAQAKKRQNPEIRTPEKVKDRDSTRKRRIAAKSSFENLCDEYFRLIKCSPTFICSCCGQTWYQESTCVTSQEVLESKGCSLEYIAKVLHVTQTVHRLCGTCRKSVAQKRIPKLCLSNGFDFPPIPEELKDLSPLEERLVSLRLPFMQIRPMGYERQSTLRGNVVNVENDLDVCAEVLPRKFNDTSTVQVQLMRRMRYRVPYMYETIRPFKVQQAARYLVNSDLYVQENVLLSEDWRLHEEGDTLDFIAEPRECHVPQEAPANDSNDDKDEEEDTAHNSTSVGAEETLIYRENDPSIIGVRIAPGEGKIPMALHTDLLAEVLSFPTIYCGAPRTFKEKLRISYTDIAKSEIRRYDRRACRPTKLLYAFKKSFNEKVYQSIQVCLRKKLGNSRVTAGNVLTPGFLDTLMHKDEGYAVFKNLRSSPSYWKEKTKKVLAMVRQLGKCTFFITLSAAETKWTELLVMLVKILKNKEISEDEAKTLSHEDVCELIRSDPVTCMRHFEHRNRALLNQIMKPAAGMFAPYKLSDYFSRLEFQMRGSPHSHGLYWIQDAPVYEESNEESKQACIRFIDEFITCERSEEGDMENLIGYQIHKHSHTCKKKLKRGQLCRFGFPKPPMKETMILDPLPKDYSSKEKLRVSEIFQKLQVKLNENGRSFKEDIEIDEFLESLGIVYEDYILAIRSTLKRTTVVLKRSTNAAFINGYNTKLLKTWRANIDFQFVLDTYACAKYCVGYIMKSEGGVSQLLRAASIDVRNGNFSVKDKLKKFANILINGSEISSQEAAAFLLGIPNTICSRQDVFINTAHPNERIKMLKKQEELDNLDEDSEDVCARGLIDYYVQRPEELEDVCLAEFASSYEVKPGGTRNAKPRNHPDATVNEVEEDDDNDIFDSSEISRPTKLRLLDYTGYVKKRIVQKVIRFRNFGKDDPKNYAREKLMLFVPWRDEDEELLLVDEIKTAEAFQQLINKNSLAFYNNHDIDDTFLQDALHDLESTENEHQDDDGSPVDNHMDLVDEEGYFEQDTVEAGLAGSSRVEQFLPPRFIEDTQYNGIMRSLNEKQRRFVLEVLHRSKISSSPFYFFLSGGAGVGKSHAINAIVQTYMRFQARIPTSSPEEISVLVAAPTGKAAFNVFGMTLHCTFKLPPNQYGGKLTNLDDATINTLRMKLRKVKLFIIDEISMVSVRQLYDIDQRLRQVFATSEDFGGKSIIVVGHLRQLPPVAGKYVFKAPGHLQLGDCVGNHLWEKFSLYELDEIMRQKGELEFCKALNNMAEGCMDSQDIELIKSREVTSSTIPPRSAIRLFGTNEECREYNTLVHSQLDTEGCLSRAFDRVQGSGSEAQKKRLLEYAATLTPQQSDGLPFETHLQVDGEYFVSTNVDVPDGLFNGSTGSLKMIEYGRTHLNETIPRRAWMDFRNPLIGTSKKSTTKSQQIKKKINLDWVAIDRLTRNLSKTGRHHGLELVRTQIPLVAANGMTIAKSQGSSLPCVVVTVRRFRSRLGYLSRKLTRESLYVACSRATTLQGLFIEGEFESPLAPLANDPVTEEMDRLRKQGFTFTLKFLQDFPSTSFRLYFHNVQSFIAHFEDLRSDACAMSSEIVALVEPHLKQGDTIILPGYNNIHRTNCRNQRNSEGCLVFAKSEMESLRDQPTVNAFYSQTGHCIFVSFRVNQLIIFVVYKSPKYSDSLFVEHMKQQLDALTEQSLVIGDANINLQSKQGEQLIHLFSSYGMKSMLDLKNSTTDGGTHIDICYSNANYVNAWIYEAYYSYHKPICVVCQGV